MPLSYSDVMSRVTYLQKAKLLPFTGYNAILYARWLPSIVVISIFAAVGIVLSLFLPWFSIGNTAFTSGNIPLKTYNGFEIATTGATLFGGSDIFSFPLLLLSIVLSIVLVTLSFVLFISKTTISLMSRTISLTYGIVLLIDVIYFFASLFGSFLRTRGHLPNGLGLAVNPSYGLWVSLSITIIAGGLCLILFSNLKWYWRLAQEDVEQVAKRTGNFSVPPEFFR